MALNRPDESLDEDMHSVQLLNEVKQDLQACVKQLGEYKFSVTHHSGLDQGEKSKVRIKIESLLIDLNELIFEVSESLA